MNKGLDIEYDEAADVVIIEGIRYSGVLFRDLGFWMPVGMEFKLVKREDGVVTIQRLKAGDSNE